MKLFTFEEKLVPGIDPNVLTGMVVISAAMNRWLTKSKQHLMLTGDLIFRKHTDPHCTIVTEHFPRDLQALVLVRTQPGEGGSIWLTSNWVNEEISGERVVRKCRPFEEAVGVESIVSKGDMHLIRMAPGASFRVCRNGRLQGKDPELTFMWTGRYDENKPTAGLRVFGKKYRAG